MALINQAYGPKRLTKVPYTYRQAVLELFTAGLIWGGSFTLMRWGLESFSATTLIFWRFLIAFILGEALHYIFNKKLFRQSWYDARLAMLAGFFLGLSLFFQTYGLYFTTATNSGFITSLYVVLIPIIGALFFKTTIKAHHIVLSLMAFCGMGFLLDLQSLYLQKGEVLTLGAALTAAFQIIFIGKNAVHARSAFRFNNYQTFWSLLTILPFLVFDIRSNDLSLWPQQVSLASVLSMLSLAIVVSIGAFYLQVRAQRVLSTTTSSMLCLLEAPFAFIFAAYFLQERLGPIQFLGAAIILLSCTLSIFIDRPKNRRS
ncbi:DMT family transporter [Pseudobdellovibrio exovorus]|uniref:Transmembrane protein n=1 Tax=Pseudobdellovibrio exovorus JSS TaxID=1184267 RepID=M4V9S7_9BACT|nr:DMT family transporter [Pseudobdellovibrio exovorus]AGH95205.1 transmembrane protein [Pseudobdellovibrio exovorus JSS]